MTMRNNDIYSPACYIPLIKMAKKKYPTYYVKYLGQTHFYSSIRTGRTHGDAKVDISQLQYTTYWVSYILEHTDTYWRLSPQRLRVHINLEMKQLQNNKEMEGSALFKISHHHHCIAKPYFSISPHSSSQYYIYLLYVTLVFIPSRHHHVEHFTNPS